MNKKEKNIKENKQEFVIDMKSSQEKEKKDLRVVGVIVSAITIIGIIILMNAFTIVKDYTKDKVVMVLVGLLFFALLIGASGFTIVKKTIGWKLGILLLKLRRKRFKGYNLIKIFDLSGIPQYQMVKTSSRITYPYLENGLKKTKMFFYDAYAKYYDFNGIPVVDVNPEDINPKNPFTGTRINISPEVIEKNIADNSKSMEQIDNLKQWRKWLLGILVVAAIAGFFLFDLYSQRLADANGAAIACYKEFGKSATIVAGAGITKYFRRK